MLFSCLFFKMYIVLLIILVFNVDSIDASRYEDGTSTFVPVLLLFGPNALLTVFFVLLYFFMLKPFVTKSAQKPPTIQIPTVSSNISRRKSGKFGTPWYWSEDATNKETRYIDITHKTDSNCIRTLVYHLWKPKSVVFKGKDTSGMGDYKFIEITKVERVENVVLFQRYDEHLTKLARKELKSGCFKTLEQETSYSIKTTDFIVAQSSSSVLEHDCIRHDLNEHFLFHGTLSENVKSICESGLNPKYVERNMLGDGVYFADDPTKSNQYTDKKVTDPKKLKHTGKTILLLRVCLGELHIQDSAKQYRSPPCRTCLAHECKEHALTFDSVVYVPEQKFKEFVVYQMYRSYPEYVITYDRVKTDDAMKPYLIKDRF